jgi:hypothetical protein
MLPCSESSFVQSSALNTHRTELARWSSVHPTPAADIHDLSDDTDMSDLPQ